MAVFDGHIGQEASEMASKLVLDYIFAHSMFGSFKNWLSLKEEQNTASQNSNEDVELELHKSTLGRWVPFDTSLIKTFIYSLSNKGDWFLFCRY